MHFVYILYSKTLNKYYVGETKDISTRLELYNTGFFKGAFTSQANDWSLEHEIKCKDITQARAIETHIKKMKSRKFIETLIAQGSNWLLEKFN